MNSRQVDSIQALKHLKLKTVIYNQLLKFEQVLKQRILLIIIR